MTGKPSFEKLVPSHGESFRCFDRASLRTPTRWHRHPEVELTYVPNGTGSRLVGDHIGSYRDHDLVLVGSDLPHTWGSDADRGRRYDRHSAAVVQFHPEFLGPEFFATVEFAPVADLLRRANRGLWYPPEIAEPIGQRLIAMQTVRGGTRLVELLSILNQLAGMTEVVPLSSESFRLAQNRGIERRVRIVCDHVARHLTDPNLSQAVLAKRVSMNRSAFSRFFKQSTGKTVSGYIAELRIGLACRLLTGTDDSIARIGHASGFANLSNFNRTFRRYHAMTPREYRSRNGAIRSTAANR